MTRVLLTATFIIALLPLQAGAQDHDHHGTTEHHTVAQEQVSNSICPVTADEPIDQLSTKDRVIRFAGKFHPVTVHFPIALLIAALFSELLGSIFPIRRFREAARVLVNLGAPMAAFAAALGWATGLFATYPGELEKVLSTHRWLGSSTAVLALTTLAFLELYWRKQDQGLRIAYLVALTLTALFVGITGHFGGTLIHGTEHFKW